MKFLLPADTFPKLTILPKAAEMLKNIANDIVQERIAEFHEHVEVHKGHVDTNFWKKIKVREQISVYKERHVDPATTDANGKTAQMPVMLTVGTIEGNLNDVMYGALTHSTDGMRIRNAYLDDRIRDGLQLASLVNPSTADPLRSLTLKWSLKENLTLTPPPIVRMRDFVFLEGTGIVRSTTGERVGYHLVHTVELPGIHELHEYNIVRSNISICFLYRQVSKSVVSVYSKGILNGFGSIPAAILALGAAETLVSVGRYVQCADLKKLAWIARTSKPTDPLLQNPKACGVCTRKLKSASYDDTKSRCCACRDRICSRCAIKKKLAYYLPHKLNALSLVKMRFCTRCVLRAKQTSAYDVAVYEVIESESGSSNPLMRESATSSSTFSTQSDE